MYAGIVTLDLHGKTCLQARLLIDSRLRSLPQGVYRLRLIHGFHGGTELRDMIYDAYRKHPRVIRLAAGDNAGVTELVLRELY